MMKIKCGWAEFLNPSDYRVIARGQVSARAIPNIRVDPWDGEVRLIRGYDALLAEAQELWILRFEEGLAPRWIELQSVERQWAPSGLRAVAFVRSYDDLTPPVVNELGGE